METVLSLELGVSAQKVNVLQEAKWPELAAEPGGYPLHALQSNFNFKCSSQRRVGPMKRGEKLLK